ncbi:MAG: hypothetical protein J0L79_04120 [Rickettsiales bacterium]|nr:hypothetical protein [Rickettsiales bacterium]MCA0254731.1 class I SAM-dependent methyltransferase [Pseudomonadota bacterium]
MLERTILATLISSILITYAYAGNNVEVFTSKDYNWSKVLQVPPGSDQTSGNQILHFKSANKHYTINPEANKFVSTYFVKAQKLSSDAEVLKAGSDAVTINGLYVEAGVCTGKTINFIAALNPLKKIYGFDSFEGLPEDWVRKDKIIAKGTFAAVDKGFIPPVLHNVILYKGWFKDSLPVFKESILKDEPIAFLHIDSDIYSAAKEVFDIFGNNIGGGTIIVFDELYNYPGFENHEWKAFQEFLKERKLNAEYIAFNQNHEQVAVKIIKP